MQKLVRLSVTTIEQYRRFKQFEYITEQAMIDKIKGVFTRSDKMDYGEDFGIYIEKPETGIVLEDGSVRMPSYGTYLAKSIVEIADEYRATLQSPIFETPVRALYLFNNMPPIVVSGRTDVTEGLLIRDVKTTSNFDIETYEDSLQWRYYLDMLKQSKFVYDVFELKGKVNDPENEEIHWPQIADLHSFCLYAYPTLKQDCRYWLAEIMEFIRRKGLMDYVLKNFDEDPELTPMIEQITYAFN
jgi:hypothetical protein